MKKIIIILFAVQISCSAQEFWIKKPSPTSKILDRIMFVDTLFGWASGDSGTIIHTSNGGQNWSVQNSGITVYHIDDMFFLNRRLGWAISNDFFFYGTKILKTTNGGLNWNISVFQDTTLVLYSIYFRDSLNGFLGAYNGNILKTTDGGNNWFDTRIDTAYCPWLYLFPKLNFSFLNAQTGFVCGGQIDIQGIIWKTNDGGSNWLTYCITPEPLRKIKALYPHKTIAVGGDFEYNGNTAQSLDSGNTWRYDVVGPNDTTAYSGICSAIAFRTPSELWVPMTYSLIWALSLDSGNTTGYWYDIPTPDSSAVNDAVFVNPRFGWACGDRGVLLKYNPAVIGITNNENYIPDRYKLYQNYPNPFNPATVISYYIHSDSKVRIVIYDLLGREVRQINEGIKPAGQYKTIFSSKGLASGVYFYMMIVDSYGEASPVNRNENIFTETRKMVILK